MSLPTDSKARKEVPVATGVLDYFPDAIAAVAAVSKKGNEKHNPGQPLHWSREKSADHRDCIARHLIDAGNDGMGVDENGDLHLAACAWRALAALQLAIEAKAAKVRRWCPICQHYDDNPKWHGNCDNVAIDDPEFVKNEDNPWREWKGGEYPPCAGNKLVEYRMREAKYDVGPAIAERLRWSHLGRGSDIVTWRFA